MFIFEVLRVKGYHVETIHLAANVELAVRKLAEHRIGALVVQDSWMRPVGIFSERDFITANRPRWRPGTRLRGPTTDVEAYH